MVFTGIRPVSQLEAFNKLDNANMLSMATRASNAYSILNREQLLEKTAGFPKLSRELKVLQASAVKFPLNGLERFELKIDDAFFELRTSLILKNCHDFKITFKNSSYELIDWQKYLLEICSCDNFQICNANIIGGRNIVAITQSNHFEISACHIEQAEGYGIIVHNANQFQILQCHLKHNLASGIMVIGNCQFGLIDQCVCDASTGYFNFDAGIHLCATSKNITLSDIPEHCHEPLNIEQKQYRPYGIVIRNCRTNDNRAQGIYLEGAMNCLMVANDICRNNKEGICFDWGSSHNIFENNNVVLNGERKNLSQQEIAADFILEYPMLNDGSSSMKLAGVSIDNGVFNILQQNRIVKNYGGGIKMVRSALFNHFDKNLISFNSKGSNYYKPYFYGISAQGLGAINDEFEQNRDQLLDFIPSKFNTYSNNVIRGHSIAVFSDKVSKLNYQINNLARFYYGIIYTFNFFSRWLKARH